MSLLVSIENANESGVTRQKVHRWLFIASLSFLCIGLSTSKAFTSIGQLALGINWLAEGNFVAKWRRFKTNRVVLVLCSFYIMHLLGLLYSTDFAFGGEDVKIKLPLFILPLMFCTTEPLTEKERNLVLSLFIGGLTFVSFLGTYRVLHHSLIDIHKISPYISSIRLALMIVFSIFLILGYAFSKKWSWLSFVLIVWALWLLAFLVIMESLTGIVIAGIVAIVLLMYYAIKQIRQKRMMYGIVMLSIIGIMIVGSSVYLVHFYYKYFPEPDKTEIVDNSSLLKQHEYYSGTYFPGVENGHIVGNYIAPNELKREWGKRSKISFDSLDRKGNILQYTLIRYLTSMGLRKDSAGISKLSINDIRAIEGGIPNYNFTASSSMEFRLYEAFWEVNDYKRGGNISGHSITQRFEFWRAAIGIIKQHWLIGVGTGDVRKAFDAQYVAMHTTLDPKFRLRAHNQYLEIGVAFGIIGIIWLLFSVIYPAIKSRKLYTYAYFIFWLIFMLSMFSEDTLETQAGATFYALFNSFFLFLV
ncbi:MAG TPA: O-antigen ligase family protein [Bacteroidia bacterium]|jgi:hypothetical protein|nr:O-antigen ligase family protein [Bacteroidia bacterium]